MTDPINLLKSGKCLCLECNRIAPPGFGVRILHEPEYTTCYYGCRYANGRSVRVVTWQDVLENFPNFDIDDHHWLRANYPELAEGERREAA